MASCSGQDLGEAGTRRIAVGVQGLPALVIVVMAIQHQGGLGIDEWRPEVLDPVRSALRTDVVERVVPVGHDAGTGVCGEVALEPGKLAGPVDGLVLGGRV